MTFRLPKAACAALLLVAGSPAAAAERRARTRSRGAPTTAEDIRILHEFCALRRAPGNQAGRAPSSPWISAPPPISAGFATLPMTIRSACRRRAVEVQQRPLRRRHGRKPASPAGRARRSPAAHVAYDPARPAIRARDESEMMFLCTVRAAPAEVAALLRDRGGERRAEAALLVRAGTPHGRRAAWPAAQGLVRQPRRVARACRRASAAFRPQPQHKACGRHPRRASGRDRLRRGPTLLAPRP